MKGLLIFVLLGLLNMGVHASTVMQLKDELKQKKFSRAATTGLALLRQQPDDIQVLFLTALAFQYNQQPEQAERYYREIIKQQPDLPEPLNNLAMIQLQQGKQQEAADLLVAALNTHSTYATAWQNLSTLYRGMAANAYDKALSEEEGGGNDLRAIQLVALDKLYLAQATTALPEAGTASTPVAATQTAAASTAGAEPVMQSPPPKDPKEEFIRIVQLWAKAWQDKDFESYINAYTANFKGRQRNHQAWVRYRRERILRPGDISIKLSQIQVRSHSQQRAVIDFHQAFKSPTYRDKVAKRIVLIRADDRWLISRESTLAVL